MADEPTNAAHPPCPKCHSRDVVPVVFGLYDDAGLASLRREYGDHGFVIGGCIVGDRAWDWSCNACGAKFSDDLQFIEKPAKQFSELKAEMKAIVERLKAEGKMPTIQEFADAVQQVREEYQPKILAARGADGMAEQYDRNPPGQSKKRHQSHRKNTGQ